MTSKRQQNASTSQQGANAPLAAPTSGGGLHSNLTSRVPQQGISVLLQKETPVYTPEPTEADLAAKTEQAVAATKAANTASTPAQQAASMIAEEAKAQMAGGQAQQSSAPQAAAVATTAPQASAPAQKASKSSQSKTKKTQPPTPHQSGEQKEAKKSKKETDPNELAEAAKTSFMPTSTQHDTQAAHAQANPTAAQVAAQQAAAEAAAQATVQQQTATQASQAAQKPQQQPQQTQAQQGQQTPPQPQQAQPQQQQGAPTQQGPNFFAGTQANGTNPASGLRSQGTRNPKSFKGYRKSYKNDPLGEDILEYLEIPAYIDTKEERDEIRRKAVASRAFNANDIRYAAEVRNITGDTTTVDDPNVINAAKKKTGLDQMSEKMNEHLVQVEKNQDLYRNAANIPFSGDREVAVTDSRGKVVGYRWGHSKGVAEILIKLQNLTGWSVVQIKEAIISYAGLGVAKNGVLGSSPLDYKIPDALAVTIGERMLRSAEDGTINKMVGEPIKVGGTVCYPLGVWPSHLITTLCDPKVGDPEFKKKLGSAQEQVNRMHKEFVLNTVPKIQRATRNDPSQRYALANMIHAVRALDGFTDGARWGLGELIDVTVDSMFDEAAHANPAFKDVFEEKAKLARERLNTYYARQTRQSKDKIRNGAPISASDRATKSFAEEACDLAVSAQKTAALAGNIPLMVTAPFEHGQGSVVNWTVGLVREKAMSPEQKQMYKSRFKVSDEVLKMGHSEEAKEASVNLMALVHVQGRAAVAAFKETGLPPTTENVRSWIASFSGTKKNKNGEEDSRLIDKFNAEVKRWSDKIMPGNYEFMAGIDNTQFFTFLGMNMMDCYNHGELSLTKEQIDTLVESQGIGKAILQLADTDAGYEALIEMTNPWGARISPAGWLVNHTLNRNGFTRLFMSFVDNFPEYSTALFQNLFPMSNTISYLITKKVVAVKNGRPIADPGWHEVLDYQMGGNMEFHEGLRRCMTYDAMKLGNNLLTAVVVMGTVALFGGIEEPEDKTLKYNWKQYKVGGKSSIPLWALNDLMGSGVAIAMGLMVGEKYGWSQGLGVLESCLYDMVDGSAIVDVFNIVVLGDKYVKGLAGDETVAGYESPDDFSSRLALAAQSLGLEWLGKFELKAITQFMYNGGRDSLIWGERTNAHSWNYIYNPDNPNAVAENDKILIDDIFEANTRRLVKNHPFLAICYNWLRGVDTENGDTGYLYSQMPLATSSDPTRAAFKSLWEIDLDDEYYQVDDPQLRNTRLDDAAMQTYQMLEGYGSPEAFLSDGGFLSYNARMNMLNWLYAQQYLAYQAIDVAKETANAAMLEYKKQANLDQLDFYEGQIANDEIEAAADAYVQQAFNRAEDVKNWVANVKDTWITNENIPWSDQGYVKLDGETMRVITWKDSGEAAPIWAMYFMPDSVDVNYLPQGNPSSSLQLYTTVRNGEDTGYNFETISGWYDEKTTDNQKVYDSLEGVEIPYGRFAGQQHNDVVYPEGPNQAPVIGVRGYVPYESAFPAALTIGYDDWGAANDLDGATGNKDSSTAKVYTTSGMGVNRDYSAYNRDEINIPSDLSDGQELFDGQNEMADLIAAFPQITTSGSGGSGSSKSSYGSRSYSRSSGGSSYAPKIYSTAKSINGPNAYSVGASRPYSATMLYLRPSVETRGSRKATRKGEL